jgi:hypothetical protein
MAGAALASVVLLARPGVVAKLSTQPGYVDAVHARGQLTRRIRLAGIRQAGTGAAALFAARRLAENDGIDRTAAAGFGFGCSGAASGTLRGQAYRDIDRSLAPLLVARLRSDLQAPGQRDTVRALRATVMLSPRATGPRRLRPWAAMAISSGSGPADVPNGPGMSMPCSRRSRLPAAMQPDDAGVRSAQ